MICIYIQIAVITAEHVKGLGHYATFHDQLIEVAQCQYALTLLTFCGIKRELYIVHLCCYLEQISAM